MVRIGRHAAEGIIEAAAEQEADLIIFGWGGKSGPHGEAGATVFSPTIDEVVRVPATSRSSSSGATRDPPDPGPRPRRTARRAGHAVRGRAGAPHGATVVRPAPRPGRRQAAVRAQAERALAAFARQHLKGPRRADPARDPRTCARRSCARPITRTWWSWAPPRRPRRPAARISSVPCRRPSRQRAKPSVIVVKTREPIGRETFEQLASSGNAGRRRPGRRGVARRPGPGGALVRRGELPPRRVRGPAPADRAQGEAGRHGQPGAADAQRGGDDRADRAPRHPRDAWSASRSSTRSSSSTRRPRTDTREIAEAEGARVIEHPDVLARYGSFVGKGEALWKSLYETSGDIVVWADTDVRNWHHRMVYGTLGPLLVEPRLQYVKGYYQRPIVEGGVLKEGGGGRVTELVARPLVNLFYPELSGFIQPLAGEYAGPPLAAGADPVLHRVRGGDRPPDRCRRAGGHRAGSARWTSSGGCTGTRSSRGCRGCRS